MKYINIDELIIGAYYHCITYDNEDVIMKYDGRWKWCQGNTTFNNIEYVIARVPDLIRPSAYSPLQMNLMNLQ